MHGPGKGGPVPAPPSTSTTPPFCSRSGRDSGDAPTTPRTPRIQHHTRHAPPKQPLAPQAPHPLTHIRATFHQPAQAAHWYLEQLGPHTDSLTGTYAALPDAEHLTQRLSRRHGIIGGWWLTGQRFLSLNLIACHPPHPCPNP
ncbi:hypothetical protein ACIOEX_10270 [Streptomyces sp. NPDC087850]|uniref:hypothetical protein n=1 Tax=Streptomyces sp. NPDC087850 TaxID=3365809 RepID=UPI00382B3C29